MSDPETCHECGSAEVHRDSETHKCRACDEKGGNRSRYVVEIDKDKLRDLVGDESAAIITAFAEVLR